VRRSPDPSEQRVKLTLHYDGAGFAGWQVQPDARTVQREVETALSRITDRAATVIAAGRTDAGVHATGQVASALVPLRWEPDALRRALNAVLPADVWVASAERAPPDFHARFDALARAYIYRVGTADVAHSPFLRRWCWPLARPLDRDLLTAAAARFAGEHSFRTFARAGQPERGDRCTVHRAVWRDWPGVGCVFHVTANRFLHHMVRYMVGTMVDVARGRRPVDDVDRLLAGESGLETSPPAPAAGLFLSRVCYDASELESEGSPDEVLPGHR
jgi:tRNA pseudouridine38-40 synthase